jgi:FkbM family methyltransferase
LKYARKALNTVRDNRLVSLVLSSAAKPLDAVLTAVSEQLRRKVRRNGVTIHLPNGAALKIAAGAGINVGSLLFWHGLDGYEPETTRILRFLFERCHTFVDVGANFGLYSLMGALTNPRLQVISFEPVPTIFAGLRKNVKLNRLEDRVQCENAALSSRSGRARFFMPQSESSEPESTGTLAHDSWQERKGAPSLEVETVRFDDYQERRSIHPDLVKIDVEDFEADVLEGMRNMILRDRPFIVCEVLPRAHRNRRTEEIVHALGYHLYWITSLGYFYMPNLEFPRGNLTNFLMSPVFTTDTVLNDLNILYELRAKST